MDTANGFAIRSLCFDEMPVGEFLLQIRHEGGFRPGNDQCNIIRIRRCLRCAADKGIGNFQQRIGEIEGQMIFCAGKDVQHKVGIAFFQQGYCIFIVIDMDVGELQAGILG